jgi:DNA (cytosine-5)-methyltransferase 1
MLENVRGLLEDSFQYYRDQIDDQFARLGYRSDWKLLNASDFGVPQLRPRVIMVAIQNEYADYFSWPLPGRVNPPTVGETLYELMASRGWPGVEEWKEKAKGIAPTIVGGSHKHGGPDLGPTRAKRAWATLGVDGHNIATESPGPDFEGMPRLTVEMVALLQGFPPDWKFSGKKTNAYRQVGNAFPPPIACAVAEQIRASLTRTHAAIARQRSARQMSLQYD